MEILSKCLVTVRISRHRLLVNICRHSGSWKRKIKEREDISLNINQYAGDKVSRSQRLYVWGCAASGALGVRTYLKPETKQQRVLLKQNRPAKLQFLDDHNIKIQHLACGYGFTVFAAKTPNGHQLLGTGVNTDSQIGYHEKPKLSGNILDVLIQPATISLPLLTPDTTRVVSVACGRAHTIVLTDNEGVFTLGNNSAGQCCRPVVEDEVYAKNPNVNKILDVPDNIKKIICGLDHTLFLTEDGTLYGCGLGTDGQTGLGRFGNVSSPTLVQGDISGEKIIHVSSKADTILAVSDKGDVFGWGNSEYNQLSLVTEECQLSVPRHLPLQRCGRVVQTAAAGSACAILNDKGEVFVWGYGILGVGPKVESAQHPQQIPPALFGRNELQESTVVDITCGVGHFVARTDAGMIYSWGKNREGCLGLGKDTDQFFPLKVSMPAEAREVHCGVDHTVVLSRSFS